MYSIHICIPGLCRWSLDYDPNPLPHAPGLLCAKLQPHPETDRRGGEDTESCVQLQAKVLVGDGTVGVCAAGNATGSVDRFEHSPVSDQTHAEESRIAPAITGPHRAPGIKAV